MRDELAHIWDAISEETLPADFDGLFGVIWDTEQTRFHTQEGFLLDFKDRIPKSFTDEFGASIIRLAVAFYNTFGGLIVFGVSDDGFRPSGLGVALDIEAFNNVFKRATGRPVECLFKIYTVPGGGQRLGALLVPKRGNAQPVRLQHDIGPYNAGLLWMRDRHEIASNVLGNIALLYSDRSELPSTASRVSPLPIHKSIPPSPATMHRFIGRDDLMIQLWDWFVFSDRPRVYVHGPGGSGKSTLAHEFARSVADVGFQIILPDGDRVDYVLYLSAKETEFNPLAGVQQDFALRQFADLSSELQQILFHSGHFDEQLVQAANDEELGRLVEELFSSYSGLIVLDDIDALSRRGLNTGEELLFLAAAQAKKPTRIIYTLRFPPPNAAGSGVKVPGLNDEEYHSFLQACCMQFQITPPSPQISPRIQAETSGLPLLIETVVGLRGVCGTFEEALHQFRERGGDDARRYLYQREYDRLEPSGKSREVLAALMLLQEAVQFSTLQSLLGFSKEKVADAISETGAIFVITTEGPLGESLYKLAEPSVPFIRAVSSHLGAFRLIERKIHIFRRQDASLTPTEAALLHRLVRLMR
ncbi:MAG: AAA family ATPase, partial [Sphingomicrobium sp.]